MIKDLKDKKTNIDETVFVADSADIMGNVTIGEKSSVWYGVVIRGDMNTIEIGHHTNIQDNSVVHVDSDTPVKIGNYVSVGHGAIIHGCEIGDNCLIGMGAIVLDNTKIGNNCIIGAGAVVSGGKEIPDNSLVLGVPARVVKEASKEQIEHNKFNAERYSVLGHEEHK